MNWLELADRCQLFMPNAIGNPMYAKPLLVKLLKEAEMQVTRSVNILESSYQYTTDGTGEYPLPLDFKSPKMVMYKRDVLRITDEDEIYYKEDGTIDTGTPEHYYIKIGTNGSSVIVLDRIPSANVKLTIHYYALAPGDLTSPQLPEQYHIELCDDAVFVSSASQNPELSARHNAKWDVLLEKIKRDVSDQELNHRIKEDV